MLEQLYSLFENHFSDTYKGWEHFIEFLAADNSREHFLQLHSRLEWLFKDKNLCQRVLKVYDPRLLRSDYRDHLGEMYLEKIAGNNVATKRGQFLTPDTVSTLMGEMCIPPTEKNIYVLDPAVGSGRLLMAAHKRAPHAVLFGVDVDLSMYHIALANFAIHNIHGFLLHADSLLHETDIATTDGRANWAYANRWDSCIEKLVSSSPKATITGSDNGNNQTNLF